MHPLSLNDWLVMTKAPPALPTLEDYPQTLRRERHPEWLEVANKARLKAKAEGHKTYDSGYSCQHGHRPNRYTQTGACVTCVKEINQE